MVREGYIPPLYVNYISGLVGSHCVLTPDIAGLVVVYTDAGVVAARAGAANFGTVEIGPCGYGLEDGAFGACVFARLEMKVSASAFRS